MLTLYTELNIVYKGSLDNNCFVNECSVDYCENIASSHTFFLKVGKCSCFNLRIVLVESQFLGLFMYYFSFSFLYFSFPVITDIWTAKIVCKKYFQLMIAQNWFLVRIISLSTLSGFSTSLTRKEFSILMWHNANIASAKNRLNGVENLFCSCVSKIFWLPWNGETTLVRSIQNFSHWNPKKSQHS